MGKFSCSALEHLSALCHEPEFIKIPRVLFPSTAVKFPSPCLEICECSLIAIEAHKGSNWQLDYTYIGAIILHWPVTQLEDDIKLCSLYGIILDSYDQIYDSLVSKDKSDTTRSLLREISNAHMLQLLIRDLEALLNPELHTLSTPNV